MQEKTQLLRDPSKNKPYVVPEGWKEAMTDDSLPSYYYGVYHQYMGIEINKIHDAKVFACRDLVLSYTFSKGQTAGMRDPPSAITGCLVDLFSDPGGWRTHKPITGHVYKYLRDGLVELKDLYLEVDETVIDDLWKNHRSTFDRSKVSQVHFESMKEFFLERKKIRIGDEISNDKVDGFIYLASLLELPNIKADMEVSIMYFLMTLVKAGQVTDDYMKRKMESFKMMMLGSTLQGGAVTEYSCNTTVCRKRRLMGGEVTL